MRWGSSLWILLNEGCHGNSHGKLESLCDTQRDRSATFRHHNTPFMGTVPPHRALTFETSSAKMHRIDPFLKFREINVLYEAVIARCRTFGLTACVCVVACGSAPTQASAQAVPAGAASTKPHATTGPPSAIPPAVKAVAALFDRALRLQRAGKLEAALEAYRDYLHSVHTAHLAPAVELPAYHNMLVLYHV